MSETKEHLSETNAPRVALVCDWLTTPGGAEKVLLELHKMYPKAPIFTSQYDKKGIKWFNDADVRTGWLQIFPTCLRKILGPLRQFYFSHLDLSSYDLVISVTGAEAKAVKTQSKDHSAYHICYCHVPTQYYWQMYRQYLANTGFGPFGFIARFFLKLLVNPLRRADLVSASRPDQFVTISTYAAEQIQIAYHRTAEIIYPPVDVLGFSTVPVENPNPKLNPNPNPKLSLNSSSKSISNSHPNPLPESAPELSQYYIISCRQVNWKRVDLVIEACLAEKLPLWVVGDGPEHNRLKQLAQNSPLIHFVPWATASELARYLYYAIAYIFPSREPFGVAAVEALAAGCPVIAYDEGGSRDIVEPGKNGLFFSCQTPESLARALREFRQLDLNSAIIKETATRFDCENFRRDIATLVERSLQKHRSSTPSKSTSTGDKSA